MSLLAALTFKVSAILLLTLAAALCLRTRSAAARHWVLAVGVVSACAAPALHVLPVPPVVRVAPAGALDWSAGSVLDLLRLRPYALFTADAGMPGSAVTSESAVSRPGRSRGRAVAVRAHAGRRHARLRTDDGDHQLPAAVTLRERRDDGRDLDRRRQRSRPRSHPLEDREPTFSLNALNFYT